MAVMHARHGPVLTIPLRSRKSHGRISRCITSIRTAAAVLAAAIALTAPDALHAQNYPARSVTLVVPSAAGGGTDTIARLIGDQLSKQLGQGFVVENRTGAGMLVGTTAVAKAAPDGYTLLVGLTGNMSVNPSLFAKLPYDPLADFVPVAMLANYPFLVVVNNDLPVKSIKELIAHLKAKPGKVDYASAGNGTGQHLAPELFKMMTGTDMKPIALPRRAAGLSGRDLRPGAGVLRQHVDGDEPCEGRQGARARDHLEEALAADARTADGRGIRRAGLRVPHLVRVLGAQGHAAGGRSTSSTPR